MRLITNVLMLGLLLVVCSSVLAQSRKKYEPTWESLDQHQTPQWFMDAKLGLFVYPPHQTEAEWKAYRTRHGLPDKPYLYGDGAWDKVTWDADALAQTAVDMGARYLVLCADPTSYFLIYPSKYADIEGSLFTSYGPPGRDMLGEVAEAVRERGLRFGIYLNYLHPDRYPQWPDLMREVVKRYQPVTLWFDGERMSDTAEK
ncbi:MAG: alpha-L-fucosidase, partial [Phycisphaeraceae bacterium]|nr:alpha-L-fucosidase [Phycisphaeraceae bacterium]